MNIVLKLGAGALIACAAITAAGCAKYGSPNSAAGAANAATPNAPNTIAARSTAPAPSPYQNPDEKIPRVSIEEAKKLIAERKAVIIDVRGDDAYKASHIKGAASFPLNKIEAGDFKGLPKNKLIIAYCG